MTEPGRYMLILHRMRDDGTADPAPLANITLPLGPNRYQNEAWLESGGRALAELLDREDLAMIMTGHATP